MFSKLSNSIYQHSKSKRYYYIIEMLSEIQIQLSLFEINLLDKGKDDDFSIMTSVIQPISLIMNLRSPGLYGYFMDDYIKTWIINIILLIYLVIPLFILLSFIKTKYMIVPIIAYLWMSYFGYVHLYIISYIIHSWLVYQIQKAFYYDIKNSVLAGLSLILIIINIIISIFICKIYISRVYLPGFIGHKSRFSRWMNLIFKLTFPIIKAFHSSPIRNITFLVLLIIWGILRQVNLVFANPYYNYKMIKMMSYLQGITFGIIISNSIAFLIQRKVENASNIYGLLLFFTSSFSSKFFMLSSDKKVDELLNKTENLNDIDCATQYWLIDQFTYNCRKKGIIKQNTKQNELISNALLFSHQDKCGECHNKESLQCIRSHLLSTKIFEGLKIHKNSFILNCLALNFYLREKYDAHRSCFLFEKLKRAKLTIEDQLILKTYEAKIEEALSITTNDNNFDYGRFAACENFYESFLGSIKNATETYIKFWSEINLPMPNLLNLIKIAIQIREDHKKFKKKLKLYKAKYLENFARPLLLAGLYYNILKNNHDESFFMLQRYTKFMAYWSNTNVADQITSDTLCSKDNVNIRISGSEDSLGKIVSCSGNINSITNLTARKLIGQNISYILPNFFKNYHNDFVRNFKETGISNIINKCNFQFCKHEYGHLVPVKINVAIYPIQDCGLMFLGIMRIIKPNYEYILIHQDGEIEGMTSGISVELNFNLDQKINFCSLLHFNRHNPYKASNADQGISPQSITQNVGMSQCELASSSRLIESPTSNLIIPKFETHLFLRMPQAFVYLFQNFVNDYFKDASQEGRRLILKKISSRNSQKDINDDNINCECYEYQGWPEKTSYKFGLQLYKLRLRKCDINQSKTTLKYGNPKIHFNKTLNYEDTISIQSVHKYRAEPIALLANEPFRNKPEFVRDFFKDSDNKPICKAKKKVSYSIKSQIEYKPSLLSINLFMPKINNLTEANSNLQEKNTFRKETISSRDYNFYIDRNMRDSNSMKSKYNIKNTKIKSNVQKKVEKNSGYLFKFRSIFLKMNTNLMIILFMLSIVSIFTMYGVNTSNISEIDKDLMISYYCNQRLANLIEINRRIRIAWLIKANLMSDTRQAWRNMPSLFPISINKAYEASQFLIGNNSLIAKEIQDIDTKFQDGFYSQLVTLYDADKFGNLLPNYTKTNSFIAGYQIYQIVSNLKKLPTQQITMNNTCLFFILRNALNDIYIEYERSEHILRNEIDSSIFSIEEISFIILIVILVISINCMILLLPGLSALFYKKKSLLMQIVNINIQYCHSHIYKIHQFLKGLQESYSDAEFSKIYEENQAIESNNDGRSSNKQPRKKPNTNIKRMVNTSGIKLDLAKSFSIILVISGIYIVVFYSKKIIVATYMENINTAIQRILYSSKMFAEQSFAMSIVYEFIGENGTTIVKNNPIEVAINETMPILGDLQGFLINFRNQQGDLDPNLEYLMVGNLCKILPPDSTKDCLTLAGGPGQNGISSTNAFIYSALNTALTTFKSSNRTTQDIYNIFWSWDLRYLEAIFYKVTIPSYGYLYNQLLGELDNQINSFKNYVLAWALTSFLCLLIIKVLIWLPINRKLINEIMSMRRIMKIIPKSIIEKGRFYRS